MMPNKSTIRTILSIALAVMTICACSHNKPSAKLNFVKIERLQYLYQIDFESDLNVEALFDGNRNQKVVHRRFVCALEDDHDFSVGHTIARTFDGTMNVSNGGKVRANGKFGYTSQGDFIETTSNGSSNTSIDGKILRTLLAAKQTVPCKLYMTVYLSNPYFSETLFIRTAALLKAVQDEKEYAEVN
jgi:hypothetical protein